MGNNRFIIRNFIRGLLWLGLFLTVYILFKKYVDVNYLEWFKPIFDNKKLIYTIFLISEIVIGIIPPEIFIIWALRYGVLIQFLLVVGALSVISYLSGVVGYFIGRYLNVTLYFRYIRIRFLGKMEQRLQQFGLYLIIIAALTPIPFSGVAMLIGSVRYPLSRYLLFSLFRFMRFAIYAWVFWEVR